MEEVEERIVDVETQVQANEEAVTEMLKLHIEMDAKLTDHGLSSPKCLVTGAWISLLRQDSLVGSRLCTRGFKAAKGICRGEIRVKRQENLIPNSFSSKDDSPLSRGNSVVRLGGGGDR